MKAEESAPSIDPAGPGSARRAFWHAWDWAAALVAVLRAMEVPAVVALDIFHGRNTWELAANLAGSAFLFLDMASRFFRPVVTRHGTLVGHAARQHYLRSYFAFDLVGSLPWGFFAHLWFAPESSWGEVISFLCLLRLARVLAFSRDFVRVPSRFFITRRLTVFLLWIGLIIHLLACGWISVGGVSAAASPAYTYIRALYWSVSTVSTTGFGDIVPRNEPQMIYTMLSLMIGAGLYATIVANVASLLTRSDSTRAAFDDKISRLNTLMKYKKMPEGLQKRILAYHDYLWQTGLGHGHEALIQDLSPGLQRSVGLFLNRHILEKVPLLKGAETAVVHRLVSGLRTVVYTPGDTIIHHGEPGSVMYLINQGEVEVVDPQHGVVATLGEGDYFGEISLLAPGRPRLADVRAKTFCTLSMIDHAAFGIVLEQFPEFAAHVRRMAAVRMAESDQRSSRI